MSLERNKEMLKHLYRFLGLVIIFAGALFLFGHNIEVMQMNVSNEKVDNTGETLPIISLASYGTSANRLFGYTNNAPAGSVRESITVVGKDKIVDVIINEYLTKVNRLNFEIRDVSDESLLDSGSITAFSDSDGMKKARIKLETNFNASTEYALKITLVTDVSKKINYYTRIKYYETECYLKEKIDFALAIHNMTMKKDEGLASYLEPDASADNSSYAHVNINSSFENVTWGQLKPKEITAVLPTVREINVETAAISLDYYITMDTDIGTETYYVNEFYRVKHTEDRMFLLCFERNVDAQFDAALASVNKNELKFGIMPDSEDVQLVANDTAAKVAFSRNGNVYMYDMTENKIYTIYEEYVNTDNYDHELYRQQDAHIISVDEEGNVCFVVYGYIAHGDYEGKVAVLLYKYVKSENAVDELLYVPFQKTYQVLKENFEEYSYLSSGDVYYFAIDDKIYSYNLVSKKLVEIADEIDENNFTIISDANTYVWESDRVNGAATKICIMNLESGDIKTVEAGDGNFVRLSGVMGTNVVYGTGKVSDINIGADGSVMYPMVKVDVLNKDFQIIKSYQKKKIYITDAIVNGNSLLLKRVKKQGGSFVKKSDDNILNRMNEVKLSAQITTRVTDKMLTEKYLSLPQGFNMQAAPALLEAKIFVLKEEKALYIDDSVNSLKFYVFAKGQIKNSFKDPARAVVYADSEQGVVIDSENQVVWERGGRFLSSAVAGLDTVKVKKNESSVYTCAYMMLKTAGANVDMKDITKSSEPVMNLLGQYIAEPVNLSGCTFDEVLYFVSGKKPVVGMKDAYNAVVIVSYTTTSVTIYDPSTGKYSTISHSAADSMFSSAGNIFFSYVK